MVKDINNQLIYTGRKQPPPSSENEIRSEALYPYLPSKELVEAVNLSIFLQRPLLLKGEPGCGKTQLARAVAYELELPYEEWLVKSTSKARDGLYVYDAIAKLRDAQLEAVKGTRIGNQQEPSHQINLYEQESKYIKWGALGRAFKNERKTIVLIDEIDKADIDFPNDLLSELEECRFVIEEIGSEIRTNEIPIIFITSNDEKELPDAFLRRCLFHYIEFPHKEKLKEIIFSRFPNSSERLIEKAVVRFLELRKEMQADKGEIGKKVTTSELLDWFRVLRESPEDNVIRALEGKLPHPSILLKTWEDHQNYLNRL